MRLKILLPFRVFLEEETVTRMVVDTGAGSMGILPHRLDCIAALVPGILAYETEKEGEVYMAVDEGVLAKTGPDVLISVRNAIGGKDLDGLRDAVERTFLELNEQEKAARLAMAKLEVGFLRRLGSLEA